MSLQASVRPWPRRMTLALLALVAGFPGSANGACLNVTCFQVTQAGDASVNGLYVEKALQGYAGPMAYTQPGTNLWLYRWHQTWWYLSQLDSTDDFTNPMYSSPVTEPAQFPPSGGWYHDKMLQPGLASAPVLEPYVCNICPTSGEVKAVAKCSGSELEKCVDPNEPERNVHDGCVPSHHLLLGLVLPIGCPLLLVLLACRVKYHKRPPSAIVQAAPEQPRHYAVVQGPGGTHSLAVTTTPPPSDLVTPA